MLRRAVCVDWLIWGVFYMLTTSCEVGKLVNKYYVGLKRFSDLTHSVPHIFKVLCQRIKINFNF